MGTSVVEKLIELKDRYDKGDVSALVGAGFSKNVDQRFPSWRELLEDMIRFTYEDEITQCYRDYRHMDGGIKPPSRHAYEENIPEQIIRRDGYFKIVDNFIRKKGFREAVESYIEERIPRIEKADDKNSKLTFVCSHDGEEPIRIPDAKLDLHEQLLRCSWENIFTTNYDCLLEYVVERKKLSWSSEPVVESSQLSFRSKKAIIKMHGSLADKSTKGFGFDNDLNKRYVICSDDYDSYPQKHEAFTQYMRISLLKGCFCLFGFSGDDPNFISWITWVRDILGKAFPPDSKPDNRFKVFLLSIDKDPPPRDKQLFYDNHKIAYIPLMDGDVKKKLKVVEGETRISVVYKAFFDYLLNSISPEKGYLDLWREIEVIDNTSKFDRSVLDEILKEQSTRRFVKQTGRQEWILDSLLAKQNPAESDVKLMVAAMKDMQLLPGKVDRNISSDVEKLDPSSSLSTKVDYEKMRIREETIHGRQATIRTDIPVDDNHHVSTYEHLLCHAFNLEFTALKEGLAAWEATGVWSQRKAMLLALFDEEASKLLLSNYLDTTDDYTEKYYTTELLNYVYRTSPAKYPTEDFKHKKLDGIYDYIQYFNGNIQEKRERKRNKIKPWGNSDTTFEFVPMRVITPKEYVLRLLQLLMDLGMPISLESRTSVGDVDWYYAFKELYEYYPLATLFYSIQLSDRDILRRIGQEYACSDSLFQQRMIPRILDKLLAASLNPDTPVFYKKGILIIAAELLVAVPATKWESRFINIWNQLFLPAFESIEEVFDDDKVRFITKGLAFVRPKNYKKIIANCLKNAHFNRRLAVNCLYYLKATESSTISYGDDNEFQSAVNKFIAAVSAPEDFTILGNIYSTLNESQKKRIAGKVASYIEQHKEVVFPPYTLQSLFYFVKDDQNSKNALKQLVIRHPNLFDNGISEDGGWFADPDVLEISTISDPDWTSDELRQLYGKLSTSISQLKDSPYFKDILKDVLGRSVPLLREMDVFLETFWPHLENLPTFDDIYKLVHTLYLEKRKFVSIEEALVSTDTRVIDIGIDELIKGVENTGIEANVSLIRLLVDRVLFKRPELLLGTVKAVRYLLEKNEQEVLSLFEWHLKQILDTYTLATCLELNLDIPGAYMYFTEIACLLQKNGITSPGVDYWITIKKSKRFN